MSEQEQHWYAIRVTYARELKVKALLDTAGIIGYIPMCIADHSFTAKNEQLPIAVVPNLILTRIFEHRAARFGTRCRARDTRRTEGPERGMRSLRRHMQCARPDSEYYVRDDGSAAGGNFEKTKINN